MHQRLKKIITKFFFDPCSLLRWEKLLSVTGVPRDANRRPVTRAVDLMVSAEK